MLGLVRILKELLADAVDQGWEVPDSVFRELEELRYLIDTILGE